MPSIMQASRFILRDSMRRSQQLLVGTITRQQQHQQAVPVAATRQQMQVRAFSAPNKVEPDWVRASIQKLMEQHNASAAPSSEKEGPRDLDKSLQALHNQLDEAEMCVKDCQDCENVAHLSDDVASAEKAIKSSVGLLVDLLDDLRVATPQEQERFTGTREELVGRLKKLRSILDRIRKEEKE